MTVAITGATGQLGRIVIEKLKSKLPANQIVALARSPEKAGDLAVPTRAADYSKPETLPAALGGIDSLLLISSSEIGHRAVQHRNVIEAAKQAGVRQIVYTSLLHANSSVIDLAEEHRATEAVLRDSGLPFVLLRNGWYTENYTGSIPGALAGGAWIGSAGQGLISAAARADYAEAAAIVLTTKGHDGKAYELAGDASFTLSDLAAEISRQTGKTVPYRNLPEGDYAAALIGFGLPDWLARAIAGWEVAASHGALHDEGRQLSALIGRPTTTMAATVADSLK